MGSWGVGQPAGLLLHEFGSQVWAAFGHMPFQVGSSLKVREWHDVDVRLILPDREYRFLFGSDIRPNQQHLNARWVSLVRAYAALGKQMTGLPIDFQIQQQTAANKEYGDREKHLRSALGIVPGRRR